ncbi:MAG: hypothetical protein HY865_17980 [Chloroflexi bacterium]|nr:hypothetical protein [Chloroflexota bacterium]
MMTVDLKALIVDWLTRASKTDVPQEVVGLNVGLFETPDSYTLYLACCDVFDENDGDWACSECYEHPLRYLEIPSLKTVYPQWDDFQEAVVAAIKPYIESDSLQGKWFGRMKGITVGFDDGDLIRIK